MGPPNDRKNVRALINEAYMVREERVHHRTAAEKRLALSGEVFIALLSRTAKTEI